MLDKQLHLKIKAGLAKEPGILAAYVIGSAASGRMTPESDFDLAVVTQNRRQVNERRVYELVRRLKFPKDLDLSVVDTASSPLFLYQIVSKGRKIYAQNQAAVNRFEAFSLHNYYDTAHMREIYNRALKRKFTYAG